MKFTLGLINDRLYVDLEGMEFDFDLKKEFYNSSGGEIEKDNIIYVAVTKNAIYIKLDDCLGGYTPTLNGEFRNITVLNEDIDSEQRNRLTKWFEVNNIEVERL